MQQAKLVGKAKGGWKSRGSKTLPPFVPSRHQPQSVAACLPIVTGRIRFRMGTKSRETSIALMDARKCSGCG
jgi:hypothetical protein